MTIFRRLLVLLTLVSMAPCTVGQAVGESRLQPLAFLSGRWISNTPGEMQEELWTPVNGDSMTGTFRVVEHGKPVFYEFWVVELDDNRPVLKLKHFNTGLVGWEEKGVTTTMPLVSTADGDAVFAEADGKVSLHYHRKGTLLTCIVHHMKNGKGSDETFALTRALGE